MDIEKTKEIHRLLLAFTGLFHEKYLLRFRNDIDIQTDLKKNQRKILNLLYHESPITLTEIGKRLDIEKGSLTALIDVLMDRGLVIRSNDPKDRRKCLIYLSPQGNELVERLITYYSEKMEHSLSNYDPQEVEAFEKNLRQVVDFLKKV
ncbi:MarR family transcriptional regulator [Desulfitobacterium sp. THU1]|uniref:MarR family winged helix-turn-helix transcriptional regulator n=1 Tax=Desulfitobacterium sp. THU1 TaxID=3138072 RepID=UPI0031204727